jgi:four helix bundle protein
MGGWKSEKMELSRRRNVNRGYRKLTVWQNTIGYYALTCEVFRAFPFVLQRVPAQQIASVNSIHRNIAEGYCRRSVKEYLLFLNFGLSSAGESVSGLHAYRNANQISEAGFERLDTAAWKLENGLKRLIESLQSKEREGGWQESFVIRESNTAYRIENHIAEPVGPPERPGRKRED